MAEIKIEGTPQTYGDGAIRNSKDGKPRIDLIPFEVLPYVLSAEALDANVMCVSDWIILNHLNEERYCDAICSLVARMFVEPDTTNPDETSEIYKTADVRKAITSKMLLELGTHFAKGAAIYGEHNCEKGIPLESFHQSAMRHTVQYFCGDESEPHGISAIWNCWMAAWTVLKSK